MKNNIYPGKKIKLLTSGENKNYKETNMSVYDMYRIGEVKALFIKTMDNIYNIFDGLKYEKVKQDNIEVQVIENNIIKNISNAERKNNVIMPIIPKSENWQIEK